VGQARHERHRVRRHGPSRASPRVQQPSDRRVRHNGIEYLVEALDFVARGAVSPWVEVFPKQRVQAAYDKVVAGDVRFKAVVTY
jgi:hypothetical protein